MKITPAPSLNHKRFLAIVTAKNTREWFVFKKGEFKVEPEAVASVLKTLASLQPGLIMLSEKAMELAEIVPTNHAYYDDYCIPLL